MEDFLAGGQGIGDHIACATETSGFLAIPDRDHPIGEIHHPLTRRQVGFLVVSTRWKDLDGCRAPKQVYIGIAVFATLERSLVALKRQHRIECAPSAQNHSCKELVRTYGKRADADQGRGDLGKSRSHRLFHPACIRQLLVTGCTDLDLQIRPLLARSQ